MASAEEPTWHAGGCHCGAVRFRVRHGPSFDVYRCNCSVCHMKQNHHFIVPARDFELLQGAESLTTYTFNTGTAKHQFCKMCGVQAFYVPRSNPDGFAVTIYCLDAGAARTVRYVDYDGRNWEASYAATGIAARSQ